MVVLLKTLGLVEDLGKVILYQFFLFTIVVEGLAGLVKQAINIDLFKGFHVLEGVSFNLIQFADDTILVGDGFWSNLLAIKSFLRGFKIISRLRINMWKRKTYGIGARHHFLHPVSYFLSCKIDSIPFKFIGIMIGSNPKRYESWKFVLAMMRGKLTSCKVRFLSIASMVTLINLIINNFPVHHHSLFKAHVEVIKEITSIQRNFFWHWYATGKGICWVK